MKNSHGLISLIIAASAFFMAIIAVFQSSLLPAVLYLFLILGAFGIITAIYCAKCLCREHCNHLILGKISVMLRKQQSATYTTVDLIAGVGLPLLVIILFPQYWLVKNTYLLVVFWLLLAIAGIEIYLFVCKSCPNKKCALCRNKP